MNINRIQPAQIERPKQQDAAPPKVAEGAPEDSLQSLSAEDQKSLQSFRDRNRSWAGILLTMPKTEPRPDVAKARDFVSGVVQNLAGDRLQKEGINLVIDIYSGDQLNAFMAGITDSGTSKVFRRLVSEGQDGKPVYELGINAGSLAQLQSEEELAFLLGHELTHLFEHHSDPEAHKTEESRGQAWLSSQAHEAVADHGALEMMVQAGYNPEGGLVLLNRLHARAEALSDRELADGLESGVEAHHHEGVRLSLAQGAVEQLRRTNPQARPGATLHPLPDFVQLHNLPTDEGRLESAQKAQKAVAEVTAKYFLDPGPLPWMSHTFASDGPEPQEVTDFRSLEHPDKDDRDAFFRAGFKVIQDASAPAQVKGDAVMRLCRCLSNLSYQADLGLNGETKQEMVDFLAEQSKQGWSSDIFIEHLRLDMDPTPKYGRTPALHPEQNLATSVLLNPAIADVAAQLYGKDEQWQKLVDRVPEFLVTNRDTGKPTDLAWVTDIAFGLARGGDEKPTALNPILKKSTLDFLRNYDYSQAITNVDDRGDMQYSAILYRMNEDKPVTDAAFNAALRATLEPTVARFEDFRDQEMTSRLNRASAGDDPGMTGFLISLGHTASCLPFRPESQAKLRDAMLNFAQRANHEQNFLYSNRMGLTADPLRFGLGEVFAQALNSPDLNGPAKAELMDLLAANTPADKPLPHQGPEAEAPMAVARYLTQLPKEEILRQIETDHEAQETGRISHGIGLFLGTAAPADLSDDTLKDLKRRVDAGEFFGKARQDDTPEQNARHLEGMRIGNDEVAGVLAQIGNRQLSIPNFLAADRTHMAEEAKKFDFSDLKRMTAAVERVAERGELISKVMLGSARPSDVSSDTTAFLLEVLLANQDNAKDLGEWYDTVQRVIHLNPAGLEVKPEYRDKLEEHLLPSLREMPPAELAGWMGREHILDLLHPDKAGELLCKVADPGSADLPGQVAKLRTDLELEGKFPLTYSAFKEQLTEAAHLQPHQLDTVFPEEKVSTSEQAEQFGTHLRGLSALVGLARARPVADQIATIEYLMGRVPDMPRYLVEDVGKLDTVAPVYQMVEHSRLELQKADSVTRVLVANSFLAGPNSFVRTPDGMKQLLDHLLKEIPPNHQELAHRLAKALLDSQGSTDSLAMAYVMGQKNDGADGKLSESSVLNNLFDAYGVPGIKFKQYLAFTSEFADFREAFESSQDAAMPLNYYQAIKLVHDRFGDEWPRDLTIEKILGSGSVNVGMKYHNPKSNQDEVAVVGRGDIEKSTDYDFFRFKRFLESLTNTPEDMQKFGYLLGLADVIHESVSLEFNKQNAFDVQKQVQTLYHHQVDGWNVKTVDAFHQDHMTLFQEEAKGKGARKLGHSDPATYKAAMTALSRVEMDSLLGIDQHGKPKPVPLHANPDFHDGQVLIDPATHSVTLLDFGQAVPISNEQREQAIDLMRVIAKAQGPEASLEVLHQYAPDLKMEDLAPILERGDRMDIFVHLLSLLNRQGAKVPIPAVHWVLAVNRQIALGDKIGVPNEKMIRNLLLTEKLGGSLTTYNSLHLGREWLHDHIGGWLHHQWTVKQGDPG